METKVEIKKDNNKSKVKVLSPTRVVFNRLKRNKLAMAGLYILIFMFVLSFIGPLLSRYKMETMDAMYAMTGPSLRHLLGTDSLGRDILVRLMYAGRISLMIGLVAVFIETVIGSVLGAMAGFYGGIIDGIIMRLVDIFLCFPFLPILILAGALLSDLKIDPSKRIYFVMIILGLLDWPVVCRIVRGQILTLREQEFMQAAEALGLKDNRKMFKHLLPNTFPSIIVSATLGIGGAILSESALSYLGLGVMPPTPSWGNMIQVVNDMFTLQYHAWLWISPGLAIFITVISINLLGDGLRDALDPKLKR